jgi:uncharacterized protein DUF3788
VTSTPFFSDEKKRPTEASIAGALGKTAEAWRALFDRLRAEHPDLAATWRYYADGKSWLLKVTRGKKMSCWISVAEGAFRVTIYFAERHVQALLESDLSEERKADLRRPPGGKLRGVTVRFGPKRGVRDVMVLVGLKERLR